MTTDLAALDAVAQAELVRRGELSPLELVDAAIARIERHEPALNALVRRSFERARERALSLRPDGLPFPGVPTLLKDSGAEEAGQPLYSGLAALQRVDRRASHQSHVLVRLLRAGFVPLGRTNMPELAIMATSEPAAFGPTRNPWHTDYSAGGSSGGSAAAVAAGMVPVAHATDGGGSIRGPASMCGLVGLKPTRARVSHGPGQGERWSGLSCEFVVAHSVRDCAALLDVLHGMERGDPYAPPPPQKPYAQELLPPPSPLRIGVLAKGVHGVALAPECAAAVRSMADTLAALGHRVEEAHPAALDEGDAALTWVTIVAANIARSLDDCAALLGRPLTADDVEPLTFALAERGRLVSAPALVAQIERMHAYGRRLCSWFLDFDLLLSPTQGEPPPEIGYLSSTRQEPFRAMQRSAPYGAFTLPFNMSGQPALSLPTSFTATGLPIGTQLAAAYGREDLLLRVAAQIETARPWYDRRPPHFG
jgi:amidase